MDSLRMFSVRSRDGASDFFSLLLLKSLALLYVILSFSSIFSFFDDCFIDVKF
ncbi:unnamed protein product [Meloidogyne enterolobii]|uniref:Uncharacterized protein n=1 Tax=Meloidogyne enterolobii TaxID=390850 RepID=A0ACB0Z104_MELEN